MTYVERRLVLRGGPPWGFRLYEDFMEGLLVSKIRKRSPAETANLLEGDHILALNGMDALDMSHSRAVQIIDSSSYVLEIVVGRYERQQRMNTIYLRNDALRSKQVPQEITTTELQLFWEKQPLKPARRAMPPPPKPTVIIPTHRPLVARAVSPQPPKPVTIFIPPATPPPPPPHSMPAQRSDAFDIDRKIIPHDPDVSSVSVKQLMKEFNVPPIARDLRKKNYADSTFYADPTRYYPTIEEQIEMARKVADSLQAPENVFSRGVNIFERQKQHADKYVREGPDPEPDPIEMASPEELENMKPPSPPPPPPPPPPSFPGLQPMNKPVHVPPPPPPGQPKTVQEFLEKIKVFPTSKHSDLDPQKCFDIASALYTSDSRGAKMFAKRHARARKWENESNEESDRVAIKSAQPGPSPADIKAKLVSKLAHSPPQQSQKPQQVMPRHKISLVDESSVQPPETPSIDEGTPKPFAMDTSFAGSAPFGEHADNVSVTTTGSNADGETGQSGWRPVKFKMAQTAS